MNSKYLWIFFLRKIEGTTLFLPQEIMNLGGLVAMNSDKLLKVPSIIGAVPTGKILQGKLTLTSLKVKPKFIARANPFT